MLASLPVEGPKLRIEALLREALFHVLPTSITFARAQCIACIAQWRAQCVAVSGAQRIVSPTGSPTSPLTVRVCSVTPTHTHRSFSQDAQDAPCCLFTGE